MEPATVAGAYAAETAVEGAAGAAVVVSQPTLPVKGKWSCIATDVHLPRSSHSLCVVKGKMYIFGGEEQPRQPVSNEVHVFTLPQSGRTGVDYEAVAATPASAAAADVPPPRLGHTATVIGDRIYVYGGRGGPEMKPLPENGRVWVFSTKTHQWSFLDPIKDSQFPSARSYHCSAATEHPLPNPQAADVVNDKDYLAKLDDHGTLFIHGGCPASGRTADVWGFDIASRQWTQYTDAPGPPRGGASLVFAQDRLYRFGGFDGSKEIGGPVDTLLFRVCTFDDKAGKGELAVIPHNGEWESVQPDDGSSLPGDRSVAGLHNISTGQGRNYLTLLLGEKDPSASGHESAGRFWDDVWIFQIKPDGMTAASFKDATRMLFGAKIYEGKWAPLDVVESTKTHGQLESPSPRGWFASAKADDPGSASIVVWGGVAEDNSRLSEGWILNID